jgi:membrane-associated protein
MLAALLDIILHLDAHLLALTQQYGVWVYAILFLIIYSETGLVVAPFLPGDSLLFVAGALCGMGALQLGLLVPLLVLAAFGGDNTNYWIGRRDAPAQTRRWQTHQTRAHRQDPRFL